MVSKEDEKVVKEFGGPFGTFFIIVWSHFLMLYLWMSLEFYEGSIFVPNLKLLGSQLERAMPTLTTVLVYWGFMGLQLLFALFMPGPTVKGLPLPSENNKQYSYHCNALYSWYTTLALVFILHVTGVFKITFLMDNYGSMLVTSMISGDLVAFFIYFWGILAKKQTRMSGNIFYDFFMGSFLNPRLGKIDLKLFAEIRASWVQLFLLTLSAAVKQYELHDHLSNSMIVMLVAHLLYANACTKGE